MLKVGGTGVAGDHALRALVDEFAPKAGTLLDQLETSFDALVDEGPLESLLETIYKISFDLKSLSAAFELIVLVEMISEDIDPLLGRVRAQHRAPPQSLQTQWRTQVSRLREVVNSIESRARTLLPDAGGKKPPHMTDLVSMELGINNTSLLAALGQAAVWSFHDWLGVLAKIQGYAELLKEADESDITEFSDISQHILDAVAEMAGAVQRIRRIRGLPLEKPAATTCDWLQHRLAKSPLHPSQLLWQNESFPGATTTVVFDTSCFDTIWFCCWKLLGQDFPADKGSAPTVALEMSESLLTLFIGLNPLGDGNHLDLKKLPYKPQKNLVSSQDFTKFIHNFSLSCGIKIMFHEEENRIRGIKLDLPKTIAQYENHKKLNESKSAIVTTSSTKAAGHGDRILVLDDDRDLCSLLCTKISRMNYQVESADTISKAQEICDKKTISLIICDLFLANESGFDFLKWVKSNKPSTKFVFLTSASEDDLPASLLSLLKRFSDDFLTKPISTSNLKKAIEKHLP